MVKKADPEVDGKDGGVETAHLARGRAFAHREGGLAAFADRGRRADEARREVDLEVADALGLDRCSGTNPARLRSSTELKSKGKVARSGWAPASRSGVSSIRLEEVGHEGLGQDAEAGRFRVDVDRLFGAGFCSGAAAFELWPRRSRHRRLSAATSTAKIRKRLSGGGGSTSDGGAGEGFIAHRPRAAPVEFHIVEFRFRSLSCG